MPTVNVPRDTLFRLMGRSYTKEEFEDLCFSFGIELDDVTSERLMFEREHADGLKDPTQKAILEKRLKELSDEQVFKIDTPANRYDLLSAESLTTALKVFAGSMPTPRLKILPAKHHMRVKASVGGVRDFVVCAILRGVTLTPESYRSFNDFQDKLHSGLARKRTLASVGAHDLDKVKAPFSYEAVAKDQISFVPLEQTRELHCAGNGLAEYYAANPYINKFVPLIADFEKYPVVFDADRRIMSLPPIINSDFSKIEVSTKNIFIECTAVDHHRATTLVTQLVSAFAMYCSEPFTVEAVDVTYDNPSAIQNALSAKNVGSGTERTPSAFDRTFEVDVASLRSIIGIDVDAERCARLLQKMMLTAEIKSGNLLSVTVPPHRGDILHDRDIMEDVAIAFGYDNIEMVPPPTLSHGSQTVVGKVSHLLRIELASAGYTEMLTFSLCSRDDAFKNLNRLDAGNTVTVANPQTIEFQLCRPSLLPGTLKTVAHNKSMALPLRLFEVTDVILCDDSTRTGTRNERRVCAVSVQSGTVSFEDIHGLTEMILAKLGFQKVAATGSASDKTDKVYTLVADDSDGAFFPGRCLKVLKGEEEVGRFGVLHPLALTGYGISTPCSYVELNLDALL